MLVLSKACKLLSSFSCPCSPLGRGFLTGQIKSPDELAKDDYRTIGQPRWAAGAFEQVKADECRVLSLNRGYIVAAQWWLWLCAMHTGGTQQPCCEAAFEWHGCGRRL